MTTILFSYTGTGINIVRQNSPTIITPTIASLINVQHNHQSAVGGGSLDAAAIASGLLALARGGLAADLSGTGGSNQFLKQTSSGAAVSVAAILSADLTTALTTPPPIGFTTPNSAVFSTATVQGAITAKTTDAATNTIVHALVPSHRSSGTPTTNFGVDIDFQADSSTNTQRDLAFIEANWLTATDASREARLNFYVNNTAKVQVMTMRPSVITALVAFAGTSASLSSALTLSGAPGLVRPAADSTNALGFANAAGTQWIVLDTTNKRILLNGTASPQNELQVLGSIGITSSSETGSTARGIQEVPSTISSSTPHQIRGFGNVPGIQIGAWNTTGGVAQSSILIAPTNISLRTNATSSAGVERINIADALTTLLSTAIQIGAAGATAAKLNVNADASGIGLIVRANATTPGDLLELQNNAGANLHQTDATGLTTLTGRDSATNTVFDALIVGHDTSNGANIAQGYGTGIRLRGQSNNVADRDLARFRAYWDSTNGVDASRKSNATISVWNIGVETDVITFLPTQIQPNVPIRIANNTSFQSANAAGSSRNMLLWSGSDTLVIGSLNGSGDNGLIQLFAGGVNVVTVSNTQIALQDGKNFAVGTTTGTKIGTATSQKFAFWNATPIVQPANTVAIDTLLVDTGLRASGGVSNFSASISVGTNPSSAGAINLPNSAPIMWRNGTNTGDVTALSVDSSNNVILGSSSLVVNSSSVAMITATMTTADTGTNNVQNVVSLNHASTGSIAAGFGTGLLFSGNDSAASNVSMGRVRTIWSNATDGSQAANMIFSVWNIGSETTISTLTPISFTLASGIVFFPAQAPTASAPSYVKGGMYFDTTLNKLRIGGASGWETVTSV